MKTDIEEKIEVPQGVEVTVAGALKIKGQKGELTRDFKDPIITIEAGKEITLKCTKATSRIRKRLYTYASHIRNMLKGVTEGHFYELKICSAHFPMNVSVSNNEFIVKNFLGENHPRKLKLNQSVTVKVDGDIVRIESVSKEQAGETASRIELLTRVQNRDRRIFQDGIFIINKDGKVIQ